MCLKTTSEVEEESVIPLINIIIIFSKHIAQTLDLRTAKKKNRTLIYTGLFMGSTLSSPNFWGFLTHSFCFQFLLALVYHSDGAWGKTSQKQYFHYVSKVINSSYGIKSKVWPTTQDPLQSRGISFSSLPCPYFSIYYIKIYLCNNLWIDPSILPPHYS